MLLIFFAFFWFFVCKKHQFCKKFLQKIKSKKYGSHSPNPSLPRPKFARSQICPDPSLPRPNLPRPIFAQAKFAQSQVCPKRSICVKKSTKLSNFYGLRHRNFKFLRHFCHNQLTTKQL